MKASAPGKLIFSGEHAVVHGRPALVMAVNRYIHATVEPIDEARLVVSFPQVCSDCQMPTAALPGLKIRLTQNYQRFLAGDLGIRHVLGEPVELIYYAVIHLLELTGASLSGGLRISLHSELPIGSGMGSSAAVAAATLGAVAAVLDQRPTQDTLYRWTLDVERLQHGHPSGVDPFITVHGGFVRFQHGEAMALPVPHKSLTVVMTGERESSTGESLSHVARTYPATDPIWEQFQRVTNELEKALTEGEWDDARAAIRANHRLLCRIGVVPEKVRHCIAEIERQGGAAKVCGAGAVSGDGAGALLLLGGPEPCSVCDSYGYTHFPVQPDLHGMTVHP